MAKEFMVPLGVPAASAAAPGIYAMGDPTTGIYSPAPGELAVAAGGVQQMRWDAGGTKVQGLLTVDGDACLGRVASNVLGQFNGTTAQGNRIYNTRTDAANGIWLEVQWSAGNCLIRTNYNGTGGASPLRFGTGGVDYIDINSSGQIQLGSISASPAGQVNARSRNASTPTLVAYAVASQSADVFQARTSTGAVIAAIGAANGHMALNRANVSADTIVNIANGPNERVDTTGTAKGLDLILINAMSGAMQGLSFAVESRYAGSVAAITGAQGYVSSNNAANAITHGRAFFAAGPVATTSGGMTNAYGFYADIQKATGVTNGYCFYGAGPNDICHVNGKIGIGITSPNAAARLDVDGAILSKVYTVATLPTPTNGLRAFVSDASSSSFATVVASGGSTKVPVYSDGTDWLIG